MTTLADEYRLERHAQDQRFDARPGAGGVDSTCTDSEEYRAYFGLGDFAGAGVEERLTYRGFLVARGRERRLERESAPADESSVAVDSVFWLSGAQLAELAAAGDAVAGAEIQRRSVRRAEKRARRLALTA